MGKRHHTRALLTAPTVETEAAMDDDVFVFGVVGKAKAFNFNCKFNAKWLVTRGCDL